MPDGGEVVLRVPARWPDRLVVATATLVLEADAANRLLSDFLLLAINVLILLLARITARLTVMRTSIVAGTFELSWAMTL